jgi:2,3-bisphosphoglycerate-independent phosphoglycerate mutase
MKLGYVLLDGCGDRPSPALNYTTPLESAYTPNLDSVARHANLGSVVTVRRGVAPESDIAVFNMLGYSFGKEYPGRGVVEAVGSGLEVHDGDIALRANLASAKGRAVVHRRAGRDLTQEEAEGLAEDLNRLKLRDAEFEFMSTVSYRGVLVIRAGGGLSGAVSNTDPAYARVGGFGAAKKASANDRILECLPEEGTEGARRAASLINEFTEKSLNVLGKSRINRERVRQGKLPANCVLLRDAGDHVPVVPSFEKKHGVKGTAIVEMPAEVGIAKILGMKMLPVRDRSDMKEKAALFTGGLEEGTVVYVHIKGPDEFGHDGDAVGKKKSVEGIDRDFFSALAPMQDLRLGVSCDHATPCTIKMHAADPVPLLITTGSKGDALRFTEPASRRGTLGTLMGRDVLGRVVKG